MIGYVPYLKHLYNSYPSQREITSNFNKSLVRRARKVSRSTNKKNSLATKAYVDRLISKSRHTGHFATTYNAANWQPSDGMYIHSVGSDIVQGDGVGNRTGEDIDITSIRIYGHIHNYNTDETGYVRMLVVENKNPMDTWEDDFWDSEGQTNSPIDFSSNERASMVKRVNKDKYRVIWDKVIPLGVDLASTGGERAKNGSCPPLYLLNYRIPIKKRVHFNTDILPDKAIEPVFGVLWWVVTNNHGGGAGDFAANTVGNSFKIETWFKD